MGKVNQKIFKAYDIRGIYPDEIDEDTAYKAGRSIVRLLDTKRFIVGRDIRISSPSLKESLVSGITDQGADVYDIGIVSSDMFYSCCGELELPGIIVTASHLPAEYNGFKIVKHLPEFLCQGQGMEELRDMVSGGMGEKAAEKGGIEERDIKESYTQKIKSLVSVDGIKPLKMVVDAANGTGGIAFDAVYKDVPVDVVRMYFKPDGTFPNHGGDPLKEENRRELQERVVREGADLGCAFDPDADRFFAVDSKGEFIPGDFFTAILGKYIIEKNNNSGTIIYDTRASWAVRDLVGSAGGKTVEMRVGHPFIKAKMMETGAHFAGEVSGHYYYNQFYLCDSGVLPSLLLLEMLGAYGKSLHEIVEPLRNKYFLSGEINTRVHDADAAMDAVNGVFKDSLKDPQIDGIGLEGDDWHANIRKSNTEPLLRLNVEGLSLERMEEKRDEIKEIIESR